MRRTIAPALAAAILAMPVLAQEAPKPGPQHARIGYFVGSWDFTAESKDSPMGPGGAITGSETCEWFTGGFQLVCRGEASGPRGRAVTASVWAYDPAQGEYTYYAYNSLGESFYIPGSVAGNVWTWNTEFPMNGGTVKARATVTEEGPAAYSYRFETSADGTTWALMEEGRATKRR
jgi:hypothetical protein